MFEYGPKRIQRNETMTYQSEMNENYLINLNVGVACMCVCVCVCVCEEGAGVIFPRFLYKLGSQFLAIPIKNGELTG